jgi:hypothetical protein
MKNSLLKRAKTGSGPVCRQAEMRLTMNQKKKEAAVPAPRYKKGGA